MTKLYLSLIFSHMEYGAQVWHTYHDKYASGILNVQMFAFNDSFKDVIIQLPGTIFNLCKLENCTLFSFFDNYLLKNSA